MVTDEMDDFNHFPLRPAQNFRTSGGFVMKLRVPKGSLNLWLSQIETSWLRCATNYQQIRIALVM